jgi:hypothetical protein
MMASHSMPMVLPRAVDTATCPLHSGNIAGTCGAVSMQHVPYSEARSRE